MPPYRPVDYELTELGFELVDLAAGWSEFARRNWERIDAARTLFDAAAATRPDL